MALRPPSLAGPSGLPKASGDASPGGRKPLFQKPLVKECLAHDIFILTMYVGCIPGTAAFLECSSILKLLLTAGLSRKPSMMCPGVSTAGASEAVHQIVFFM